MLVIPVTRGLVPRQEIWFCDVGSAPETQINHYYFGLRRPVGPASGLVVSETSLIDLSPTPEELFAELKANLRYEIHRAEREGFEATFLQRPTAEDLKEFLRSYEAFSASKALPAANADRVQRLYNSGRLTVSKAVLRGTTVASHVYLSDGSRVRLLYSYHGPSPANRTMRGYGNKFLHWHDLMRFKADGHRVYDMGGIDLVKYPGISKFKLSFGGVVVENYSYETSKPLAKGVIMIRNLISPAADFPGGNLATYSRGDVVEFYASYEGLQPPEEAIFRQLGPELPGLRMLDLGVGGGRTTAFLAPRVKDYVGVDYSAEMIAACRRRFPIQEPKIVLEVHDARDLRGFEDDRFDFVLFSFNGLDSLDAAGRKSAFTEIRRVLAPSGIFCFSSHNLQSIPKLISVAPTLRPRLLLERLRRSLRMIWANSLSPGLVRNSDHLLLVDSAHDFTLRQFFIRPSVQVAQLRELGFGEARVFGLADGQEIGRDALAECTDYWLYYLCR